MRMSRILATTKAIILATPLLGASFERPIPQAQSASAELWYALASLALIGVLVAVHWLVARR